MENIKESIYNKLESNIEEIGKTIAERDELQEMVQSGAYSPVYLKDEVYPKLNKLKQKVFTDSENAIRDAKSSVNEYRKKAAEENRLNPSDLTDDIKLLQPGVTLFPEDIKGMIERNSDNRTMTQIILRYAKEHNIDTGATIYIGGEAERELADNLDGVLDIYSKWIDKPNAKEMLDKFFDMV